MKLMSTIRYRKTANNVTERSGYTQYAKIGRLQTFSPPLTVHLPKNFSKTMFKAR